ncbi:acetylcholinesterase-1-like isoform X2 [Centruroides sculpturatus]|uniref:acetylcholinesterase-1-like isoform X2 n=1 Tax=Centruroides sculpturatus TaxID=218467 RepID=UPI000C6E8D80|nr:acetylcholinesterase-1-like isoform X2 [Centruroides sculpturatus]
MLTECNGQVIVNTKAGNYMGKTIKVLGRDINAFLGIPYASPPFRTWRFHPPFPIIWKSVYKAIEKPPSCVQHPSTQDFQWVPDLENMDEDCLYLNIWVPAENKEQSPLSTMVWIHGGGYSTGSSNLDVYDGGVMASLGNVTVVSFNYRLGAFGFLYFYPHLTHKNVALNDQFYALKWIYENIEAFGGNSNEITLFGQDAGAWSIGYHLISSLPQRFFKRVIMQSGSIYHPSLTVDSQMSLSLSLLLANDLKCNKSENYNNTFDYYKDVMKCMEEKEPLDISFTEREYRKALYRHILFVPQVGDTFLLPTKPIDSFDFIKFNDVDVMLGNVADEGSLFLALYNEKLLLSNNPIITKHNVTEFLEPVMEYNRTSLEPIIKQYFENVPDDDFPTIIKRTHQAIGDWMFKCPTNFLAEKLAEKKFNVFHYTFKHRSGTNIYPKWTGVPHFEEVQFVFGVPLLKTNEYTVEEQEFSRNLIELWTSFAKTGTPHVDNLERWLPYTNRKPISMNLQPKNIKLTKSIPNEHCEFWKTFFHV